jgi:adhesin/invasin
VKIDFVPGAPAAGSSEITIDQQKAPADGSSKSNVTVTLKDANGNPIGAGQEVCLVNSGAGTMAAGPWTTDAQGKIKVEIASPTTAGTASITAKIGPCPGSGPDLGPVTVDFVPPPSAGNSTVEIDKNKNPADGKSEAEVKVLLKDASGNPIPAGVEVCLVVTSGSGDLAQGPWQTDENGSVAAMLTAPNEAGDTTVTAFVGSCEDRGLEVGSVGITFNQLEPTLADTGTPLVVPAFFGILFLLGGLLMTRRRKQQA